MRKVDYPQLDEVVYYETLANDLQVILIPKKGFAKTYGIMTADFGSVDNHFLPMFENKAIKVPDGVAHFLEHKLFEGEERDAFEDFAELGSSANAFTSFTRTSYLFSATSRIPENVETLLDFVQSPHFNEEGTEKEKGIITQEINMYADKPEWKQFYGLLENMYPNHPLSTDIAGTEKSVNQITAEILQTCYNTFYHPSNMNIVIIGNFDQDEIIEVIRENQDKKTFPNKEHVMRFVPADADNIFVPHREIEMNVKRQKISMGIKGITSLVEGDEADRYYLMGALFLELLFGRGSDNFTKLYDEGLIDDSFGYTFNIDRSFHFMLLETDTEQPEQVLKEWKDIFLNWKNDADFTEENFELLKRAFIGEQLQAFNSLEYTSNQYGYLYFGGIEMFERIGRIEALTLADMTHFGEQYINEKFMSSFIIKPKKGKIA